MLTNNGKGQPQLHLKKHFYNVFEAFSLIHTFHWFFSLIFALWYTVQVIHCRQIIYICSLKYYFLLKISALRKFIGPKLGDMHALGVILPLMTWLLSENKWTFKYRFCVLSPYCLSALASHTCHCLAYIILYFMEAKLTTLLARHQDQAVWYPS